MSTVTNSPGLSEGLPPSQEAPTQNAAALQISDLQNLLLIVDLASSRGAFRANELAQIGQVFDRVSQFLQATQPSQTAPENPPAPAPVPQGMSPMMTPVTPITPPFSPKVGA